MAKITKVVIKIPGLQGAPGAAEGVSSEQVKDLIEQNLRGVDGIGIVRSTVDDKVVVYVSDVNAFKSRLGLDRVDNTPVEEELQNLRASKSSLEEQLISALSRITALEGGGTVDPTPVPAPTVFVEKQLTKSISDKVTAGDVSELTTAGTLGTGGTLTASTSNTIPSAMITVGSTASSNDAGINFTSPVESGKKYEAYLTAAGGSNNLGTFSVQVLWRTSSSIVSSTSYSLGSLSINEDKRFRIHVGTPPATATILMIRLRTDAALPATAKFHLKKFGILELGAGDLGTVGTVRRGIGTNASIFNPQTNIFKMRTDLWTGAMHPNSASIVKGMTDQITPYNNGNVNMNLAKFNSNTYFVDNNTPRIKVEWVPWRSGEIRQPLWPNFADSVPWPADARPSEGTDRAINIYNPQTGELWEFWKVRPKPGYPGSTDYYNAPYITATGGEMQASYGGYISDASQSRGHFSTVNGVYYGVAATSISYMGCAVTVADVLSGEINHTLAVQTIYNASSGSYYWPALRSDGNGGGVTFQGQRFRFPPSIDFSGYTSLSPLARMVAKAIQKYGLIITDTAGTVSLVGESGAIGIQSNGTYKDPWGELLSNYGSGLRAYNVLQGIPWHLLEAMPANWGQGGEATIA